MESTKGKLQGTVYQTHYSRPLTLKNGPKINDSNLQSEHVSKIVLDILNLCLLPWHSY